MALGNSVKNAHICFQNTWQLACNINKCNYFLLEKISMTRQFKVAKERTKMNGVIAKNSKFLPVNVVSTCSLPQYPG